MTSMTLAMRLRDRLGPTKMERPTLNPAYAYAPVFFNDWEWLFLTVVIKTVVPEGEDGSRDATGVPMFIDRQMASSVGGESCWHILAPFLMSVPPVLDYQLRFPLRELYRRGIAISIKLFRDETGCHFSDASEEQRCSFLFRLAAGRVKSHGLCGRAPSWRKTPGKAQPGARSKPIPTPRAATKLAAGSHAARPKAWGPAWR